MEKIKFVRKLSTVRTRQQYNEVLLLFLICKDATIAGGFVELK